MKIVHLLTLMILSLNFAYADWNQTSGPCGLKIQSFYVKDDRLFAITDKSIYLSMDKGSSWSRIYEEPTTKLSISAFTAVGQHLFVRVFSTIIHSNDNGESWVEYPNDISGYPISNFNSYDTVLFATTYEAGIFRSIDCGSSWEPINNGLEDLTINYFTIKDSLLFARNGDGIFISTDLGNSWSLFPTPSRNLGSLNITGNNIYMFNSYRIIHSVDWGNTWTSLENMPDMDYNVMRAAGSYIFLGAADDYISFIGFCYSPDYGENWIIPDNNGLTNRYISAMAIIDSNIIVGTDGGGVYISSDYGVNWIESNVGFKGTSPVCVLSLAAIDNNIIAGTWGGGIFLSRDKGANWSEINVGLREKNILSLAIVKNRIFAATAHCGIYCSENGGATWYAVNNGIPNTGKSSFQISFAVRDTILFTGIWETGIYRTNDYGQNWVSVGDGLSQEVINSIYCLAADSQSIYIGGYGIYYSNDDGQNWKAMNDGLDLENRSLIVTINIRDTTFFAGDISYGVFRSTKNNPKWIPVNNGLPMSSFGFIYRFIKNDITCMASIGQYLLVGLLDRGIFLTEDNGNNWIEVSEELSNPPVYSMLINDSDVFVGLYGNVGQYTEDNNNGGILCCPIEDLVKKLAICEEKLPSGFLLYQNYPNPFNPITNISFFIPTQSQVTLKVFDILGREVAILESGLFPAGKYTTQWDSNGFPSGIYFYQLQTGKFSQTNKLLLLK